MARGLEMGKACHYLAPRMWPSRRILSFNLAGLAGHLEILDEVQRMPDLFPVLRGLIDERRRAGEKSCQFLLLGSASPELPRQSSETLAGRISYMELCPFQLLEHPQSEGVLSMHWERGGYPESFLAADLQTSIQWREDFITSPHGL